MVLARNVGGKIWADRGAGSELESEPIGAAGLIAVRSNCPVAEDEWSWEKGLNQLSHEKNSFFMWDQNSHVHCWLASHSSTSLKMYALVSRSFLQCPSESSDNFSLVF